MRCVGRALNAHDYDVLIHPHFCIVVVEFEANFLPSFPFLYLPAHPRHRLRRQLLIVKNGKTKQKAEYWYADVSDNDNEYSSSNNNTRQQQQRGKEGG